MTSTNLLFLLSKRIFRPGNYITVQKLTANMSISSRLSGSEKFRKVQEHEDGDTLIVEGLVDDKVNYAEVDTSHRACPICSRNLQVSYKDVLILDQFVSKKSGQILPQRVTGVCKKQHMLLTDCIDKAQKAGLLPPPDISGLKPPPKEMRIPKGSFNVFYRSNVRGTMRRK